MLLSSILVACGADLDFLYADQQHVEHTGAIVWKYRKQCLIKFPVIPQKIFHCIGMKLITDRLGQNFEALAVIMCAAPDYQEGNFLVSKN